VYEGEERFDLVRILPHPVAQDRLIVLYFRKLVSQAEVEEAEEAARAAADDNGGEEGGDEGEEEEGEGKTRGGAREEKRTLRSPTGSLDGEDDEAMFAGERESKKEST
jgi:hypothetical protein